VIKFLLDKLKKGLGKTRQFFSQKIGGIFSVLKKVDEDVINSLEEALILADVGVETTKKIIGELKEDYKRHKLKTTDQLQARLKTYINDILKFEGEIINIPSTPPAVFLIVGVNGVGKTTSIAKLAKFLKGQQKRVLVCAGDTHRAAAIEQLEIWCRRADVDIVKHQIGADPGAVVFDACDAAIARKCDCLIIDTAGRIQTKANLMNELAKIKRIIQKKIPSAPHETLLVLDATTGQNAISQAKLFSEAVNLSGIFLAKLDGTAKGGIIIAIKDLFNIPIKFVGTGETLDDISVFSPEEFVKAIFE
jgi:fused signal recognition particle receptor